MTGPIRRIRRRKLVRQPFPEPWEVILERQVPFYKHLCGRHRRRFLELLKIFVQEKYFIGAGGMQITDEVRVVISACAVRLVRSLGLSYYDRLTEIIVYPFTFTHGDQDVGLLGEAQDWGPDQRGVIRFDKMQLAYYEEKQPTKPETIPPEERLKEIDLEITKTLSQETAIAETKRCMSCGKCFDCGSCWSYCQDNAVVKPLVKGQEYKFKLEFCNGCKKCAENCPCGYIEMH